MKIVIGKANSGKSCYVYEAMMQDRKKGCHPLLFVPSQTRAMAEEQFMKETKQAGIMGITITTIDTFIAAMMQKLNLHFEDHYASLLDKKMILTQVIRENEALFSVFKRVSQKEGFLSFLATYMELFRKEGWQAEEILSLQLKDKRLEQKLKEMARIYQKYVAKLSEKYIDSSDEVDILSKHIHVLDKALKNTNIYIDGYNNLTPVEYKLVTLLLSLQKQITITITTDVKEAQDIYLENTNDIFEVSNRTYLKLLKLANQSHDSVEIVTMGQNFSKADPAITYLSETIWEGMPPLSHKCDTVSMRVATNVYQEIENIAYEIRKKIKEGYRYQDCCIYTTQLEIYAGVLASVFYEYDIPVYVNHKKSLEGSPFIQYCLLLLDMATSTVTLEKAIEIAKLGLCPIDMMSLSYLENYMYEFHREYDALSTMCYLNNESYQGVVYDLAQLNATKELLNAMFTVTCEELRRAKTATKIIEVLYDHLQTYDILACHQRKMEQVIDPAYAIYSSQVEEQVWDKLCEVLDAITRVYGEDELTIATFYRMLHLSLQEIMIKTIPPTKDQVTLVDIDVAKMGMKKVVFFVGVTEHNFPKKVEQDPFFNDQELEKLKTLELELKENSLSKENMRKYNIYSALSKVQDHLYLSMPAIDIAGNTTRKSSFLIQVQQKMQIPLLGEVAKHYLKEARIDDIYAKEKCFEWLTANIREVKEAIEADRGSSLSKATVQAIIASYLYLKKQPQYSSVFSYCKRDEALEKETIANIYQDTFKSSVYKLEMFRKCPFSYFMKYILQINPRKVFEITSMDTGSFMHSIMEQFSFYLLKQEKSWNEILLDENTLKPEEKAVLASLIDQQLQKDYKRQQQSVKYEIYKRKLLHTLSKVLVVVARGFCQSDFIPYGYEIEFKENGLFLPMEIQIDAHTTMKIVGKMDRVDLLKTAEGQFVRVVDYKSSSKILSLEEIKEGISLQLITYLTALIENEANKGISMQPAAMLYFNLSDQMVNLKEYTKEDATIEKEVMKTLRMKGIFLQDATILDKMDYAWKEADKKLIDMSPRSLTNENKALSQEDFTALCQETKGLLQAIGKEMKQGTVKMTPHAKGNPCQYCDFSHVCRKNISV